MPNFLTPYAYPPRRLAWRAHAKSGKLFFTTRRQFDSVGAFYSPDHLRAAFRSVIGSFVSLPEERIASFQKSVRQRNSEEEREIVREKEFHGRCRAPGVFIPPHKEFMSAALTYWQSHVKFNLDEKPSLRTLIRPHASKNCAWINHN